MPDPSAVLAQMAKKIQRFTRDLNEIWEDLLINLGHRAASYTRDIASIIHEHRMDGLPEALERISVTVTADRAELNRLSDMNMRMEGEKAMLRASLNDRVVGLRYAKRKLDWFGDETCSLENQLCKAATSANSSDMQNLKDQVTQVEDAERELDEEVIRLKQRKTQLREKNNTLKTEMERLKLYISDLRTEKADLAKLNDDLQSAVNQYGSRPTTRANCRGCQRQAYHLGHEYGGGDAGRWVMFR